MGHCFRIQLKYQRPCPILCLLADSPEGGEYEDSHHEEEHEEAELLVAVLEREGDRLQPGRVPRQLEDPHYPHYPEDLQGAYGRLVGVCFTFNLDDMICKLITHLNDPPDVVEGGAPFLLLSAAAANWRRRRRRRR